MLVIWATFRKEGFTQNIARYYQGFFPGKWGFSTGNSIYPQPIVDIINWKIRKKANRGCTNYPKPTLQAG